LHVISSFSKFIYVFFLVIITFYVAGQGISTDSLIIRNFGTSDYKASSYSSSITEDENGIIYIANENGVLEYDGSSWRIIPVRGFSSVLSVKYSDKGKIYVGGTNEFGFIERDSLGIFQYHSLRKEISDSIDVYLVWQIVYFNDDVYFQSYKGLFRYDGKNVQYLDIKESWPLKLNNELLVTVFNKGIAKLINDSLVYVDESFQKPEDAPFRILPYKGSKKIVLTEEHGLYTIDTVTYKLDKWNVESNIIFEKHGLYDGIVWDDSTYLFAATRGGIYWVDNNGNIIRKVTKNEGLQSNNMGEFHRDKRGNLWLSGDGLTHIILPNKQDTSNIKTLVRQIKVNDSLIFVNSNNLNKTLHEYGPISSIIFMFSTPGFDKIDLKYSYYLEGFDNKWSEWTDDFKKEYTNLPSGSYIFQVKGKLQNGAVSSTTNLKIHVPSLWYRTKGAYAVGIFLILLIIWTGTGYRAAKLKQKNTQLERLIGERTKDLVTQKEELIVANNELDHFVYRSSHDLVAPLKSLKGLINITRKEPSENSRKEYLDMMESSVTKLEDFIKSILEYSSNTKGEVIEEIIDINNIIDSVIADLKYFEKAEKVTLHRDIDTKAIFKSDPKRIKIILSNLIANAVKYHNYRQPSAEIYVVLKKDGDKVIIEVRDNGQGISEQHLGTIFDMFVRASDTSEGSGLGLYIVKETVDKLGGSIDVKSELGVGTIFSITFQPSNL